MTLGHTILRTIVGLLFVGHGAQKLFGWFGGTGPDGTAQMFESIGLRPGRRNALAAAAGEAGGGALVASGVRRLTPLGAAAISTSMITAIRKVHFAKGPWNTEGGYEYNVVLLGAVFAITDERSGPVWALAQLAAGGLASMAVTAVAELEEERVEEVRREPAAVPREAPAETPAAGS